MDATEGRTLIEPDGGPGNEDGGASSAAQAPLRVAACMPVPQAREVLDRTAEVIALVTHRGVDVGVVTAQELAPSPTDARTVGDVMGLEVVSLDPKTDLKWTLRAYRQAAWSSAIRRRPGAMSRMIGDDHVRSRSAPQP